MGSNNEDLDYDFFNQQRINQIDSKGDLSKSKNTGEEGNNGESNSAANINNGRWTDEEHDKFVEALRLHGKDWNLIQEFIGSRTSA